ncbi:MAG: PH domain-containing protein [Propionibacteriaceae bacterium]|jgi:membrane protein YdbS with pleckstrin-like domain|nr:PH domain-containing protein [Propionibacteriaceae bacterium]
MIAWPALALLWWSVLDGPLRYSGVVIVAGIIIFDIVGPLVEWRTNTYSYSSERVEHRRGLFSRSIYSILWSEIQSTKAEANWSQRLFGITTLTLKNSSELDREISFPGIPLEIAETLQQHASIAGRSEKGPSKGEVYSHIELKESDDEDAILAHSELQEIAPSDNGNLILQTNTFQIILYGVLNGKVIILLPSILLTSWGLLDGYSDTMILVEWSRFVPMPLLVGIVLILAILIAVVTISLRYYSFRVDFDSGSFRVRYGWPEPKSRVIPGESIVGIMLSQNIAEKALSRCRVRFMTKDSDLLSESNLVFPSLSLSKLSRFDGHPVAELIACAKNSVTGIGPRGVFSSFIALTLLFSASLGLGFSAKVIFGLHLFVVAPMSLSVFFIGYHIIRLLSTRIRITADKLSYYSPLPNARVVVACTGSLHGLRMVRWNKRSKRAFTTIGIYTHKSYYLRSVQGSGAWVDDIQSRLIEGKPHD